MKSNWAKRWGIILILLGFAIGIPGFWLLITHNHFEATARIKVSRTAPGDGTSSGGSISYDPYFIQTEFEVIQSEIVLGRVINTLHLDVEWGNKYAEGRKLNLTETRGLLRQCLDLRPVRNFTFIDIGVISEDPVEAAKIANAVAEAYLDFRWEQSVRLMDAATPGMIHDRPVQIIERAQPPTIPIGHHRPLGQALLGVGVLLLVCGFVTFVRNWRRPDEAAS